eukprot:2098968-Lingulodinium_polyedra.AAC.1
MGHPAVAAVALRDPRPPAPLRPVQAGTSCGEANHLGGQPSSPGPPHGPPLQPPRRPSRATPGLTRVSRLPPGP